MRIKEEKKEILEENFVGHGKTLVTNWMQEPVKPVKEFRINPRFLAGETGKQQCVLQRAKKKVEQLW